MTVTAIKIGVIGDYNSTFPPHAQTNSALDHVASELGLAIRVKWLPTDQEHDLASFAGLWCAPGSPYKNLGGALRAIRFAREGRMPLIGTCGGFQHMILEYARNVMNVEDAAHAEYDPYASRLFVQPLSCSLKGRLMSVRVQPDSLAARSYGRLEIQESYYCDFGLNPAYQEELHAAGFLVTGWDERKEARIMELPQHPFYLATLFVPQAKSSPGTPHPLVRAFVSSLIA